jgi:hypothetical protein
MSHTPLKITVNQAHEELDQAWRKTYSPQRNKQVVDLLTQRDLDIGLIHFLMRLFFRGIYVPQMTTAAWVRLIFQNRGSVFTLVRKAAAKYRQTHEPQTQEASAQALN